jgi:hypothetical protein
MLGSDRASIPRTDAPSRSSTNAVWPFMGSSESAAFKRDLGRYEGELRAALRRDASAARADHVVQERRAEQPALPATGSVEHATTLPPPRPLRGHPSSGRRGKNLPPPRPLRGIPPRAGGEETSHHAAPPGAPLPGLEGKEPPLLSGGGVGRRPGVVWCAKATLQTSVIAASVRCLTPSPVNTAHARRATVRRGPRGSWVKWSQHETQHGAPRP